MFSLIHAKSRGVVCCADWKWLECQKSSTQRSSTHTHYHCQARFKNIMQKKKGKRTLFITCTFKKAQIYVNCYFYFYLNVVKIIYHAVIFVNHNFSLNYIKLNYITYKFVKELHFIYFMLFLENFPYKYSRYLRSRKRWDCRRWNAKVWLYCTKLMIRVLIALTCKVREVRWLGCSIHYHSMLSNRV